MIVWLLLKGESVRVLVMEPPNQLLPGDTARPNGALGPAYLIGALRANGIEADYYDGTVGWPGELLEFTFYNRVVQENGLVRYGASRERLTEVMSGYDMLATSSIFTAQTRTHFEVAAIAEELGIPIISGGVNARSLKEPFHKAGFKYVAPSDGEAFILRVLNRNMNYPTLDDLPLPALDALPLKTYWKLGIPHAGVMPNGTRFASIQTSRGCQDRCTFCHISLEKESGEGYLRTFSKDYIRRYVDYAVSLGIQRLYFEDDNLFFSKKRLIELAPVLKRDGLEYSNVNGGNLRFLFRQDGSVDDGFIALLRDFGLVELMLPFESRSNQIMKQYATGKYDPDKYDSAALVRCLKDAGIRIQGNFMIGFHDEPWESVLATKEYARQLMAEGLDAAGFMIPVPYPGSVDFRNRMRDPELLRRFEADPLYFTDRMHWRTKPVFPTLVAGDLLVQAAHEWWLELNTPEYTKLKAETNLGV